MISCSAEGACPQFCSKIYLSIHEKIIYVRFNKNKMNLKLTQMDLKQLRSHYT